MRAEAESGLSHLTRGRRGALVAFLVYLAGALLLTAAAWRNPTTGWAGICCDQEQAIWFLGWTPHALTHGLDPFFTTHIGWPDGVNLMWNTSMPLLGLMGWLPWVVGGPIFAFNVVLVSGIVLSGLTAWLAIRRWTGDGPGPIVGGAVYAFSPYVASHAAIHLNLTAAWIPPLLLIALDELLVTRRRPAWQVGLALGALSAAQVLVSEEVLATSVIAAGALVAVMALSRRSGIAERVRGAVSRLVQGLATATAAFLVLAAWPLAAQFLGPQRITTQVQDPRIFSTDLLNLVTPTPYQLLAPGALTALSREFSGLYHEATGYLGIPLLLLLLVLAATRWADLRVRVATATAVVLLVLSLGPSLWIGAEDTGIPMPWALVGSLPILEHVLPGRFTLYAFLAVATVVAIAVDRAARLPASSAAPRLAAIAVALLVAAPAPLTRWQVTKPELVDLWSTGVLPKDETVLVAPFFRNGAGAEPMLWSAWSGYAFRMPEAYAYMPMPDGATSSGPPANQLFNVMQAIQDAPLGTVIVARNEVREEIAGNLRDLGVRHVLVGPMPARDAMVAFFTDLFGRDPEDLLGAAVWRNVDTQGVAAPPAD